MELKYQINAASDRPLYIGLGLRSDRKRATSFPREGVSRSPRGSWGRENTMNKRLAGILSVFLLCISAVSWGNAVAGEALLEKRESLYGTIFVFQNGNYIKMISGFNDKEYTWSIANKNNELEIPVIYIRYMTAGVFYPEHVGKVLVVGLGGGRTSWYLHKHMPEVDITVVELDPDVIDMAQTYFGVREEKNLRFIEKDGRAFLMKSRGKFDVIMLDAYRGPFVPFHLLTREFYTLVKSRLKEGGVVVQNIEPSTKLFESTVATMSDVFDSMDFFDAYGNVVAMAYDGRRRTRESLEKRAGELQASHGFHFALPALLNRRRFLTPPKGAKVLTDDFAPVNALKAIPR
jgi:spermidine synthase